MDVSVIPIGNSKGIRLTKTLLDKYNITDTVELVLEKEYIIIKPKTAARTGWEKSFKKNVSHTSNATNEIPEIMRLTSFF